MPGTYISFYLPNHKVKRGVFSVLRGRDRVWTSAAGPLGVWLGYGRFPGSAGTWAHHDEEAAPQGSLLLSASYAPQDTYVLLTGSENSGHDIQAVSSLLVLNGWEKSSNTEPAMNCVC